MSCFVAHESKDIRTLCFEHYRAERDRRLASAPATPPVEDNRSPFVLPLTERQVAHRRAMLDFARSLRGPIDRPQAPGHGEARRTATAREDGVLFPNHA